MDYSKNNNMKKRKANRSNRKKMKNKMSTIVFRIVFVFVLIGLFAGGGAVVGAYLGIIENAPNLDPITVKPSIYPSVIYYDDGTEATRLTGEENREYVSFDRMPQHLKDAFVAIEDERFYSHNGVDLKGMVRAVYTNLTSERTEGASTITQQLIKNNVRKISKNTYTTKLQEQYLAIEYEKKMVAEYGTKKSAKDHILELYMNSINMHYRLNGVQTAAEYYFNKDVSELNLAESAVIAGITQNPAHNAPTADPEKSRARQLLVLSKMQELGFITPAQHDEAVADDVYARVSTRAKVVEENNSYHTYFEDAVINAVVDDLVDQYSIGRPEAFNWLYNSGLSIYTTQNKQMQDIMDEAFLDNSLFPASDFEIDVQYSASVHDSITDKTTPVYRSGTVKTEEEIPAKIESFKNDFLGANDTIVPNSEKIIPIPQPQAAMVITDFHNGHVVALTGGRGEKMANLALNRAIDSPRQPGSVFKVLASYAPSIDLGVSTPATVIDDSPVTYGNWTPHNWYGGYRGLSTVRQGIAQSMNVITVKNMDKTGVDRCFQYLLNFGFTTLVDKVDEQGRTDRGLATCLGGITNGVTQLEVTSAYGTMANLGEYNKPVLYTKVVNHDGVTLLENVPAPRQVLKRPAAYLLTDMMKDVITKGTGGQARFQQINMPLAGKTGTTTDTYDLMFVGYTPYYVAGIWLGFDTPKTIKEDKGYHMRLWRTIMEKIHEDLPVKDFERPEGLTSASVCGVSGKLAVSGLCSEDLRGSMVRTDLFMAGTQSSEYCDVHVSATIDTSTRMKAGPYCPEDVVKTVVGIFKRGGDDTEDKDYEIDPAWIDGPACTFHGPDATGLDVLPPDYYNSRGDEGDYIIPEPDFGNGPVIGESSAPTMSTAGPNTGSGAAPEAGQPTPVPEYSPKPIATPQQQSNPQSNTLPDLPVIDDPVSMDGFIY